MKLTANDVQLFIKDQGQGQGSPVVLFLHYWGGSSRTWDDVIRHLPFQYRTIAPDLRGWGDSDAPADAYALNDFARDVHVIVKELDLQNYIVVGHSMGGKIAQLFASQRPAGLAGLVLVAPSPPIPLVLPPEVRVAMQGAYASAESTGMALDHMLTAKPLSTAHRAQAIEDSLRGAPQAVAAWPNSTSYEDISADVHKINVPTLVIAGELDKVDPVGILEAEILTRIKQATMKVIPGTGHLSPLESPIEVAQMIQHFVETLTVAA